MSNMSPSTPKVLTSGQIGKLEEIFGDGLRKANLQSEPAQQVIENQADALVSELVEIVRKRVEAVSSTIIRRVKVDRTRSPEQVLDATGRAKYIDGQIVKSMPRGTGEDTDIHFVPLGRLTSNDDVEKKLNSLDLRLADPESLAKVNEYDPSFADAHPNFTIWKDADGNWCFAAFSRWHDKRDVFVDRRVRDWDGLWWVAGELCK